MGKKQTNKWELTKEEKLSYDLGLVRKDFEDRFNKLDYTIEVDRLKSSIPVSEIKDFVNKKTESDKLELIRHTNGLCIIVIIIQFFTMMF